MPLTKRAMAWLATLQREAKPLTTTYVERLIDDLGGTPHPLWLEFHDRYAGYIEEVGPGELAIWGLARAKDAQPPNAWCTPERVHVVAGPHEFPEAITCADAHPAHEYELSSDGWFAGLGGPCPTFDMKLERHGLLHEVIARGTSRRTLLKDSDAPEHQKLLHEVAPWLVPEATSKESRFFFAPGRLVRFDVGVKQILLYEFDPKRA